jgi:hypothetical protein
LSVADVASGAPFFEAALESLGRSRIGARQVFDNFDNRPARGIAAHLAFIAGACRCGMDDLEAFLQVCADHGLSRQCTMNGSGR